MGREPRPSTSLTHSRPGACCYGIFSRYQNMSRFFFGPDNASLRSHRTTCKVHGFRRSLLYDLQGPRAAAPAHAPFRVPCRAGLPLSSASTCSTHQASLRGNAFRYSTPTAAQGPKDRLSGGDCSTTVTYNCWPLCCLAHPQMHLGSEVPGLAWPGPAVLKGGRGVRSGSISRIHKRAPGETWGAPQGILLQASKPRTKSPLVSFTSTKASTSKPQRVRVPNASMSSPLIISTLELDHHITRCYGRKAGSHSAGREGHCPMKGATWRCSLGPEGSTISESLPAVGPPSTPVLTQYRRGQGCLHARNEQGQASWHQPSGPSLETTRIDGLL
jgi:hypothetical protein